MYPDSSNKDLTSFEKNLIKGCIKGKRKSQELLYKHYYGYGMSVCLAYSSSRDEASEILNEAFFKIFTKIKTYKEGNSFKAWLRRTIVNTAIDYFRSNKKYKYNVEISEAVYEEYDFDVINQLTVDEILGFLHQLPEKYRLAFNLYEVEGYSHEEISQMLDIPIGTSRSNLARAKKKLRELVIKRFGHIYERSV